MSPAQCHRSVRCEARAVRVLLTVLWGAAGWFLLATVVPGSVAPKPRVHKLLKSL